jgi:hypothetical protein
LQDFFANPFPNHALRPGEMKTLGKANLKTLSKILGPNLDQPIGIGPYLSYQQNSSASVILFHYNHLTGRLPAPH